MANEKRLIGYDPVTFESFTRHATKHREPYDHYDMGYVDAVDQKIREVTGRDPKDFFDLCFLVGMAQQVLGGADHGT